MKDVTIWWWMLIWTSQGLCMWMGALISKTNWKRKLQNLQDEIDYYIAQERASKITKENPGTVPLFRRKVH